MNKVIDFPKTVVAESGDGVCQEADGCPTERAVLQRFWREHHGVTASPVTSVLTDEQIKMIAMGIYGIRALDSKSPIEFARALLSASMGGDKS